MPALTVEELASVGIGPHPFDPCEGPHLVPRDAHCVVCGEAPEHPVHVEVAVA